MASTIDADKRGDDGGVSAGARLGKYVIEGRLGSGGMGAVYRARHSELGHEVAIKVLEGKYAANPEMEARLFREAQSAARIGHAGIVRVFDYGRHEDFGGYVVMELLRGESLEERLEREPVLPEDLVTSLASQIGSALAAVHAVGVIHRDLKPANVFLVDGQSVKLLDFGVARVVETHGILTRVGALLGTPHYMSPEQWSSSEVDARSDIYSLGVMLYRMISGRLPVGDQGPVQALAFRTIHEAPTPLHEVAPSISPAFAALVMRCLAKRPEERFASVNDLVATLRGLPRESAPVSTRAASRQPAAALPLAPRRPRAGLVVLVGAGIAAALAVTALLAGKRGGEAPWPTASAAVVTAAATASAPSVTPAEPLSAAPSLAVSPGRPVSTSTAPVVTPERPATRPGTIRVPAATTTERPSGPPAKADRPRPAGKKGEDLLYGQ